MAKDYKNFLLAPMFWSGLRSYIGAGLSGLLLAFSYPAFGLHLGFLVWIGLIPLFYSLSKTKFPFWVGFSAGLIYFLIVFSWFWALFPLDFIGINSKIASFLIILPFYVIEVSAMAVFWGLFGLIFSKLKSFKLSWAAIPGVFVLLEFVRSIGFIIVLAGSGTLYGPHWTLGNFAYALANNFLILKISSIAGIYGVLFLIVSINYLFFKKKVFYYALILIAASYFYNPHFTSDRSIGYTIVQTKEKANVAQTAEQILEGFKTQIGFLNQVAKEKTTSQLIVFPEASDIFKNLTSFLSTTQAQNYFSNLFPDSRLIISGSRIMESNGAVKSRVFALDTKKGIIDYYDKRLLTPGGEFLPYPVEIAMKTFFKNIAGNFNSYRQFGVGEKTVSKIDFDGRFSISPLVCSEMFSPVISRKAIGDSDVIIGMSSTAAFHGAGQAIEELIAVARFRAAENGKPLLLAANYGLSYAIDALGNVDKITLNKEPQMLTGDMFINKDKTWYNLCGDWPILIISGFALLLTLFSNRKYVKKT